MSLRQAFRTRIAACPKSSTPTLAGLAIQGPIIIPHVARRSTMPRWGRRLTHGRTWKRVTRRLQPIRQATLRRRPTPCHRRVLVTYGSSRTPSQPERVCRSPPNSRSASTRRTQTGCFGRATGTARTARQPDHLPRSIFQGPARRTLTCLSLPPCPRIPLACAGLPWSASTTYAVGNMIDPIEGTTGTGAVDDVFQAVYVGGPTGAAQPGPAIPSSYFNTATSPTVSAPGSTICDSASGASLSPAPPYSTSCPTGTVWQDIGPQTQRGDVFAVNLGNRH